MNLVEPVDKSGSTNVLHLSIVCRVEFEAEIWLIPGPEVPFNEDTVNLFLFHSLEYARRMPRPRFIKTHLPFSVLPKDLLKAKASECGMR